jgi:ABC-type Fe3+ transport system substrate-binding protein
MSSKYIKTTVTLIFCFVLLSVNFFPLVLNVRADPDTLVILHPHSANVSDDVISDFQTWYNEEFGAEIVVQQLTMDSGACHQQVITWDGSPDADVMWGGGEYYFMSLAGKDLLEGYIVTSDSDIEDEFGGWPLKDPKGENKWYAAALSTFGIMWNEDYLSANNLSPPASWEDLTKPEYFGHIVMCDPAKSGSTTFITIMVIEHFIVESGWENTDIGWQNAWEYWANVAGNVGLFTESSSTVPDKVSMGEYGIGICIDYYAWEAIKAGVNVGFNNGGGTSISADPAGILKGAPHQTEAQRWMDYLVSKRGQEAVGKHRMPMRSDAESTMPVLSAWLNAEDVLLIPEYSREIHNDMFSVVRDMFSNWLVSNQEPLKAATSKINECVLLGLENYDGYQQAIENYNKIPESSDTLDKALEVDRKKEAANWENWGNTHFNEAKNSAEAAITEYEEEPTPNNQLYYLIAGVAVIIIIGLVYFYTKR